MHARPWPREHTCVLVSAPHVAAAEEVLVLNVDEVLGASDGRNVCLHGPITHKVTLVTQPLDLAKQDAGVSVLSLALVIAGTHGSRAAMRGQRSTSW